MQRQSDILMVPVEGDLDVTTVPRLRRLIESRLSCGRQRVILNLANTRHVDSLGVGLLLTLTRQTRERGGLLSLVNVCDAVYRTLCIARIVDFVPVSGMAPKPPIPALDPSVRPVWNGTMRVDPRRLDLVRMRVEQVLSRTALTSDEVFDMTLAGGEAVGNAVDHTCAADVLMTVSVYPDRVVLEVTDCGEGFELGEDEPCPGLVTCDGIERGRGIKLMRLLADSVEISRRPGCAGTVVRLVKLVTPRTAGRLAGTMAGLTSSASAPALV